MPGKEANCIILDDIVFSYTDTVSMSCNSTMSGFNSCNSTYYGLDFYRDYHGPSQENKNSDISHIVFYDVLQPRQHKPLKPDIKITIPHHHLENQFNDASLDNPGFTLADKGLGHILYVFCRELPCIVHSHTKESTRQELVKHFISLIILTFSEMQTGLHHPVLSRSEFLFQNICSFIRNNLDDPMLTPALVAKSVGISRSYLYKLLNQNQLVFQTYVRKCRLDEIYTALSNPLLKGYSITEIAFRFGFTDASHFSRSFKTEYGMSAREYRMSKNRICKISVVDV